MRLLTSAPTAWVIFTFLVLALPALAQSTNIISSVAELQQRLTTHLTAPHFGGAMWGVKVVSLDSGKTLFEHNTAKLFSPASNSKLYTVALALDQLGGDYRIKTSLYAAAKPTKPGTLDGDLIVYGRGAPDFNARLHGGDILRAFEPLAAVLTNAGVKRIRGDLVGDESFFRGPPFGSGWAWDDAQFYYGAEISALTANDNYLELAIAPSDRVGAPCKLALTPATSYALLSNRTETVAAGSRTNITLYRPQGGNVTYIMGSMPLDCRGLKEEVTVHNPASLFLTFFKQALVRHGIKVTGRTRTVNWLDRQAAPVDYDQLVALGEVESLPLRRLAAEIQKPSQNLYTDLLLAHVGALGFGNGGTRVETSEDAGVRALREFAGKVGIRKEDFHFEEGSGLSRNNLTTPDATIALLQFMDRHAESETYRNALPLAGVDGTLRNRFKDTPAERNVQAKTGTLRWANSISGYLKTAAGERLAFCIMLNRYDAPDDALSARREIDKVVLMLVGLTGRSDQHDDSVARFKEVLLIEDGKERHWVVKSNALIYEEHYLTAHGDLHVLVEYPKGVLKPQVDAADKDESAVAVTHTFWPSGKTMSRTPQIGGKPDGQDLVWWPNGKLAREAEFSQGKPKGIWKFYDQQGRLVGEGNYLSGRRESGVFVGVDNPGGDFFFTNYPMKKQTMKHGITKNEEVFLEELKAN